MPSLTIYDKPRLVATRLAPLGLDRDALVQVVLRAVAARNDAVAIDPINAPGLLAYIYGTRGIRHYLLPKGWKMDRSENLEATVNPQTGTRLIYQNCDICCDASREPRPISAKGAAAGRLVEHLNGDLFPELIAEARAVAAAPGKVWFLCVSVDNEEIRAELSCPKRLEGKQFGEFHERIYLLQKGDLGPQPKPTHARYDEVTDEYEVILTKKNA